HLRHGVARGNVEQQEHDDEYSEERRYRKEKSSGKIGQQGSGGTPDSVGRAVARCVVADSRLEPPLAVEDRGRLKAGQPGLDRVEIVVEEEEDHGSLLERDPVRFTVQPVALRLVQLTP